MTLNTSAAKGSSESIKWPQREAKPNGTQNVHKMGRKQTNNKIRTGRHK